MKTSPTKSSDLPHILVFFSPLPLCLQNVQLLLLDRAFRKPLVALKHKHLRGVNGTVQAFTWFVLEARHVAVRTPDDTTKAEEGGGVHTLESRRGGVDPMGNYNDEAQC